MDDKWQTFTEKCALCTNCHGTGLLDPAAFPILMNAQPRRTDILFVMEAPNRADTYDPIKLYLTIDPDTDPSGSFFCDLFSNELRLPMTELFVTNSVLCLPKEVQGSYPVTPRQRDNCSQMLKQTIDLFDPLIVCPLGTKALFALSRIESHCYRKMSSAVTQSIPWYGRIMFPLYHTSRLARNPRNGRTEAFQRHDWQKLRTVLDELKRDSGNHE